MYKKIGIFILFLICIQPIAIGSHNREYDFKLSYIEDRHDHFNLTQAMGMKYTPIVSQDFTKGVTQSTYWVKIKLEEIPTSPFVLELNRTLLDELNVFYYDTANLLHQYNFGFRVTPSDQPDAINSPYVIVDTPISDSTIYLRVKSTYALVLPISVRDVAKHFLVKQEEGFFAIILIGGLLAMFSYNMMLWFSVRDFKYIFYSAGILLTTIIQMGIQGYFYAILPHSYWLSYYVVSVGIGINIFISSYFCMLFLGEKHFTPWMKYSIYAIMLSGLSIPLFELMGFSYLAKQIVVLGTGVGSFVVLIISTTLTYRKVTVARYFQVAWSIYLIGIIVYGLRTEGYLPDNLFTANFAYVGKLIEVCLMSFALGYNYNQIRKENLLLQTQMNKELEQLVKVRTEKLNLLVEEKEVLLKEIHHRVKNNLQLVSSILYIQSHHLKDKAAKAAVREGQSRIKSMSLIHQKLYANDAYAKIDMKDYVTDLAQILQDTFQPKNNVDLAIEVRDITMDIDTAVPLGLILTELISNAYKHVFSTITQGKLQIKLHQTPTGFHLLVSDNGTKGLPTDFDKKKSMGVTLVYSLVKQIRGVLTVEQTNGTAFKIDFESIKKS
ncbi:hypothetical protein N7E81_13895 [Reichenbachiella carrageenanivorans]|uniref:histidine kinase n=1 Tax=Reichenbachiella carrageenanivorans TaxID=2979869 RepID=A0ABY6CX00_9BACT|nr:7TM diverse intracellular signaling domain-containing protein [Reichenbachiella carrageenanivorans]UXX78449.1 hypothetical protein N7E81_13895 [Reichenbachiella carrageenanivorans]